MGMTQRSKKIKVTNTENMWNSATRGHAVKESSTCQEQPQSITGCDPKTDKQSELRDGVRTLTELFIWVVLGQFLASPIG